MIRDNRPMEERAKEEIEKVNSFIAPFENHKVTLNYTRSTDWSKAEGLKQGRIIKDEKGMFYFIPKGAQKKGFHLTCGLYDGFFATLTVKRIKEGWITAEVFFSDLVSV